MPDGWRERQEGNTGSCINIGTPYGRSCLIFYYQKHLSPSSLALAYLQSLGTSQVRGLRAALRHGVLSGIASRLKIVERVDGCDGL